MNKKAKTASGWLTALGILCLVLGMLFFIRFTVEQFSSDLPLTPALWEGYYLALLTCVVPLVLGGAAWLGLAFWLRRKTRLLSEQ